MIKKSHIYWYCQVIGWSFYIIINTVYLGLTSDPGPREYLLYFFMLAAGIGISHAYRNFLIRFKILELKVPTQLLYIAAFSIIKGLVYFLLLEFATALVGLRMTSFNPIQVWESVFNFSVIFSLWNVIYFGFQYFQNYKRSEINALRYLALSRESELNNLKAQLNPHFIFNCMNSIRALVDENPEKAKQAVTQLSNILRSTLLIDKSREILLKEEMNLVNDYLHLEKIRYEERLNFEYHINEEAANCRIPPFIIQSQVENAIKHGISRRSDPGKIILKATVSGQELVMHIYNSGAINSAKPETGVGFKNSQQRLQLLYGEGASIVIGEENNMVVVQIIIPTQKA